MKLLLPVISLFLPKLKTRQKEWEKIFLKANIEKDVSTKLIWFHAASMGEFEQAKFIIEQLKSKYQNIKILVTFYSPSGYNNQKNYSFADAVIYLPDDTPGNVKKFLNKFQPDLSVFIRYEIWHNFLHICSKRGIPAILIAATKPVKSKLASLELVNQFYAMNYSYFKKIYTVGEEHSRFFESLYTNAEIITATDPRFDRIYAVVSENRNKSILPLELFNSELILLAGSSWPPDENIIIDALSKVNEDKFQYRCIFVPHEPSEEHINNLQNKVEAVLLSEIMGVLENEGLEKARLLVSEKHIVTDSIGKLLLLYSIADIAYIGGAFGAGVHSVTEPAGYGLPLATGPKINNSPDAVKLKKAGALEIIKKPADMHLWLQKMINETARKQTGDIARNYVTMNLGTSDMIIKDIIAFLYSKQSSNYNNRL